MERGEVDSVPVKKNRDAVDLTRVPYNFIIAIFRISCIILHVS